MFILTAIITAIIFNIIIEYSPVFILLMLDDAKILAKNLLTSFTITVTTSKHFDIFIPTTTIITILITSVVYVLPTNFTSIIINLITLKLTVTDSTIIITISLIIRFKVILFVTNYAILATAIVYFIAVPIHLKIFVKAE